ncbi:MAG: hypothetical protein QXR96_01350 [Candidatus Woesearchaeota archaeon]
MALFKNLYLDLSYLNPFSYLKKDSNQDNLKNDTLKENSKILQGAEIYNTNIYPPDLMINKDINSKTSSNNKETDIFNQTENLELPDIAKDLLNEDLLNENTDQERTNMKKTSDNNLKNLNLQNTNYDFYEKLPDLKLSELNIVMPPASIENFNEKKQNNELNKDNTENTKKTQIENKKIEQENEYSQNILARNNQNKNFQNFSSSYFKEIENKILNDSRINNLTNKIYNPNLLDEMQAFWKLKKEEINQLNFNSSLKEELLKKLSELQNLEIEWQTLQLQQEKINDMLFSKEILIENNQKQIKKLFKKLHLSSNVPLNNEFVLPDGKKINNLNELILNLTSMSDDFFKHHVNETKNDFYNWIKDVYGFIDLAEEIKNIKDKNQMADKIEKWANGY